MKEFFDEEFQYEAVKAIMEDREVMPSIYKILDQNAFPNKSLAKVVGIIKDFYKKNGYIPDDVSMRVLLRNRAINDEDYSECLNAYMMVKNSTSMGRETVKETLVEFFQAKSLVKLANVILEAAGKGEDTEKMIKKAQKSFDDIYKAAPEGEVITSISTDTVMTVVTQGNDEVVPTGIKRIDDSLVGGLGRKEIGLFVAPTGYGKTTAGTIFAHNAASAGYKVIQFYFEDKPEDIIRKHLAMEMGENTRSFRGMDEEAAEAANRLIEQTGIYERVSPNLILYKLEVGTTTVEDLELAIRKMITDRGFRPDMIVIDYFSCLKMSANPIKNTWDAEANAMRKIKELSFKYNMAVWVMQQTNRTAVQKDGDTETMGNWQGAYAATQPASVWLLLKRTKEQKANFRADIIFCKTRHSQPKEDLKNIVFDNSRLIIDCDDAEVAAQEYGDYNKLAEDRFEATLQDDNIPF